MRVPEASLIPPWIFFTFLTVANAFALPTESRTDILVFSDIANTTEAQPEYVTIVTEVDNVNGTTDTYTIVEPVETLERLSRRFTDKASELETCLPKVFCGINSNSDRLITHNNYKFQTLLKGLESLSDDDYGERKGSFEGSVESGSTESEEEEEDEETYLGFRRSKSMKNKKDKTKKAGQPKAKHNSTESSSYLKKQQRQLEQTKDMSAVIQLAAEIGHRIRSPRQCRNLFPSCSLTYAEITKLISATEKPKNNKSKSKTKVKLSSREKISTAEETPIGAPVIEEEIEMVELNREEPPPSIKSRDGLDTSEEDNDDVNYMTETEIQPVQKYDMFSDADREIENENENGNQDDAKDVEGFTKFANSFPDKKQKTTVDIFGRLKKDKSGNNKPSTMKKMKHAQKSQQESSEEDEEDETEAESPQGSSEGQKYSYRSETPYSNSKTPYYPTQQQQPNRQPPYFPPQQPYGSGQGGPMGIYQQPSAPNEGPAGAYSDEQQSSEDEDENDDEPEKPPTRVSKSKKTKEEPKPQEPATVSSEEEDSGEEEKFQQQPYNQAAGQYSSPVKQYQPSPYQQHPSQGNGSPGAGPYEEQYNLQADQSEEAEEDAEDAEEAEETDDDEADAKKAEVPKYKPKSKTTKNAEKDQKKVKPLKEPSSEERSLEIDPYPKSHLEQQQPKPEAPGLFTRLFSRFSGPSGQGPPQSGESPYSSGLQGYGAAPPQGFGGNSGRPEIPARRPQAPPARAGHEEEEEEEDDTPQDEEPENEGEEESSEEGEEEEEAEDEAEDEEQEKPKVKNSQKSKKKKKKENPEQVNEAEGEHENENEDEPKRESPPLPEVIIPENEESEAASESPFPNPEIETTVSPQTSNKTKKNKKPGKISAKKPAEIAEIKENSSEENKSEYEEDAESQGIRNKNKIAQNIKIKSSEISSISQNDAHLQMQDKGMDSMSQQTSYSQLNHNPVHVRQHLRNHNHSPLSGGNNNLQQTLQQNQQQSMQQSPSGVPTYSTYFQNIFGTSQSDKSEEGSIMDDFDKIANSFTTSADKASEWSEEEAMKNVKIPELKAPPRKYVVKKKSSIGMAKKQSIHQNSKSKVSNKSTSKEYSSEEEDDERR